METASAPYSLVRECSEFERKIRDIRFNMFRIVANNFDIISNTILEINILDNVIERADAVDFTPQEIENMTKVVEIFIGTIKQFNVNSNMEIPNVIASLFVKLRDKWAGHQGRVLSAVMVDYIGKYLKNYCENSPELDEGDRYKCPQILHFTGLLYNRGMFQTKYCMGILLKFMKKDEESANVFCNLLTVCFDKITSDSEIKMFNLKKADYKKYISEISEDKSLTSRIRFMAEDVMELFVKKGI